MKTFKLIELQMVDYEAEQYEIKSIPLIDGLIINREDDENQWLVEAFVDKKYLDFFKTYDDKYEEVIIHVRITTESNELATCISSIIGINEIGENMNVLLLSKIIDERTELLEEELKKLVDNGNRGEDLLTAFKKRL